MEYKKFLIFKDMRKGYVTSNRYLTFDSFFNFKGSSDSIEYAQTVIDDLICREEAEIEESINKMQCGCNSAEEHHNHTVYCDNCNRLYNDDEVSEVGTIWLCYLCYSKREKTEKAIISFLNGQVDFEQIRKASSDTDKSAWTDEYHEGYIDGIERAIELVKCGDYLSELD
jgi:hypothetical protein